MVDVLEAIAGGLFLSDGYCFGFGEYDEGSGLWRFVLQIWDGGCGLVVWRCWLENGIVIVEPASLVRCFLLSDPGLYGALQASIDGCCRDCRLGEEVCDG